MRRAKRALTGRLPPECSFCHGVGHYGSRTGCSPTHLAAELVISGLATVSEAAKRFGVRKQTVSQRLVRLGHRVRHAAEVSPESCQSAAETSDQSGA